MNLGKHYESYRASVLRDALGESPWYAKQIKVRGGEQTVYDWLSIRVEDIKRAVGKGRENEYKKLIQTHQIAMIDLYEAMVADHLWDYRLATPAQILDMIDEQGTNWFKFCKKSLKCPVTFEDGTTPMVWVPRHVYPWLGLAQSGAVIFDADELYLLSIRQDLAKAAFVQKHLYPVLKILGIVEHKGKFDRFIVEKPWLVNSEECVVDWTAPLFLKPEDMQA